MIVEFPWNGELAREVLRQRLDPYGFGGVVAGEGRVHAELHRVEERVVGALAGEVGVEPGLARRGDPAPRAAGDDPDPQRERRPPGNQLRSEEHTSELQSHSFIS